MLNNLQKASYFVSLRMKHLLFFILGIRFDFCKLSRCDPKKKSLKYTNSYLDISSINKAISRLTIILTNETCCFARSVKLIIGDHDNARLFQL